MATGARMTDDDIGTLRWFGPSWGAPVNDPRAEVAAPVGDLCAECREPLTALDQGIVLAGATRTVLHLDCFLRELGIA